MVRRSFRARLAVAFLAVAFAALALLLALTLVLIRSDVARSSHSQEAAIERGLARAVATAYGTGNGWSTGSLEPIVALAQSYEADLVVRDVNGRVITRTPTKGFTLGDATTVPIRSRGSTVGTLTMRLAGNGVVTSDLSLQRSLVPAVAISGGLAALLAVVASVLVASRVERPVKALTAAARALTGGEWSARVEHGNGPQEMNELGEAFNSLAANLEREDILRRTLTADIAHELRTPLAVLQVSIEALLDGVRPADDVTFMSLREETVHLSRVVEDLERLAEAQAAVLHLEHRPLRLDRLAGDVLAEIAAVGDAEGRVLQRELSPVVVLADESRLRQVLTNLLTNAVKFTACGDSVRLRVAPVGDDQAEIVVEDSGRGIPPEHLPHVFERFWRSPESADTTGSGIGLAIVKELVEAHGGSVTVESRVGHGSRFGVLLPLRPRSG